jgi:hypothetical protein
MREAVALLALSVLGTAVAVADPYDLYPGALIAHAPPGLAFSSELEDVGDYYSEHAAITSCDQQVNRIDIADQPMVWYVLLAWLEPKYWCGFEFGLGDFVAGPAGYLITAHGVCDAPGGVTLSIPTENWPGPNQGIAMACTEPEVDFAWAGNFVPMYWFAGYAYAAQVIPLGPNPPTRKVAVLQLPEHGEHAEVDFCLEASGIVGAMGMLMDGIPACPGIDPTACCLPGDECLMLTPEDCLARGGLAHPCAVCDPGFCSVRWACCIDEMCFALSVAECEVYGGYWLEGGTCIESGGEVECSNPCRGCGDPYMACCLSDGCVNVSTEGQCSALGGTLHPEEGCEAPGFSCGPDPVGRMTWGAVKALYR